MLSYASKLLEVTLNGTKNIQGLFKSDNWLFSNKPAAIVFEELKEIFKSFKFQTVIVIDDVDRLGKEELFEVLRIIRNTANFPNTVFIVACDKDYVAKTIGQDSAYLDKYFQYDVTLPPHRSFDLINEFTEIVIKKCGYIKDIDNAINIRVLQATLLDKFVFNYRDVKVLANMFCINIGLLSSKEESEVDFIDLLHFTLMNKYFPIQVRYLYNHFFEIFEAGSTDRSSKGIAEIRTIRFKQKDIYDKPFDIDVLMKQLNISDTNKKFLFRGLFVLLFDLNWNAEALPIPFNKEESVLYPLKEYKTKMIESGYRLRKEYSIRNIERSHIYFEILLQNDDVSNIEFSLKVGTDEFSDYIDSLLKDSAGEDLEKIKKRIRNKFLELSILFDSKIKITNTISECYKVRSSRDKNFLVDVLFYLVYSYKDVLVKVFDNSESDYIQFFNVCLWNNTRINIDFKIDTVLSLHDKAASGGDKFIKDSKIQLLGNSR